MFLREKQSGHLIEVLDQEALFDPLRASFEGRYNWGEDVPPPESFTKTEVEFCSGEALPRCWRDVHYRDAELRR
ncbi:MAG: acetyltransferase [Chromatiales bacterium]|jgi:hypothetical protein